MRRLNRREVERADDWINAYKIQELGGRLMMDEEGGRFVTAVAPKTLPAADIARIGIAMTSLSSDAFVVQPTVEDSDKNILIRLDLSEADELDSVLPKRKE